jgi:hypothetical protein
MAWRDFIDVEIIALNSQHVSGAVASVVGFKLLKWAAEAQMEPGWPLSVIHWAGDIVVSGCIIYLSIVILIAIGRKIWKVIKGQNGNGLTSLAA